MYEITLYDPLTGRIQTTGVVSQGTYEIDQPKVDGHYEDATHYIDLETKQAMERLSCPATLSGSVLSSLPTPCKITINGKAYDCVDATATLSFPQPGVYTITVTAYPYLDGHFEVTV
jgi:hypothetical protein